MTDPLWRKTLYWGVTLLWLGIPLLVIVYAVMDLPRVAADRWEFIGKVVYVCLSPIVVAMLGLSSWEKRSNGK